MARPKKIDTKEEIKKDKEIFTLSLDGDKSSKQRALDLALAQIEKEFGKGSIMTIKGYSDNEPVKHISTGSMQVDNILGKGGLTFGRVVEVYGDNAAGKTTFCLGIVATAQKLGLRCAYIDKENALDPDYAESLGVDLENTFLSQPNTGEEALTIAERLICSGSIDVIVIDSVATLNPSADLQKNLADNAKMAGRAALLTRFFERNDSTIQKNKVLLLCINQMRAGLDPYGPKKGTTGGMALKHATSYRLELHPEDKITDSNGEIIGNKIRLKTVKNKLYSPFKIAHYDLIFGKGIDKIKDIVEFGVEVGVIEKSGTWMNYKDYKFQGMVGAKEFFTENPNVLENVRKDILSIVGPTFGPEGK